MVKTSDNVTLVTVFVEGMLKGFLVHVLNCFDVAHNFVLCAWRMTVVDEGFW